LGCRVFECCAQGWFLIRIKWYEVPLFLAGAFVLFHPGAIASLLDIGQAYKYYLFPLGFIFYGTAFASQKFRMRSG
jgi:hypothetical protein